jgi:hypothetical protein
VVIAPEVLLEYHFAFQTAPASVADRAVPAFVISTSIHLQKQ